MKTLLTIAAVAAGLAAIAAIFGLPHELRKARCIPGHDGNCEYYLECEYVGVDGRWTVTPGMMPNFRCPRFMVFGLGGPATVNQPSRFWKDTRPEAGPGASGDGNEGRGS